MVRIGVFSLQVTDNPLAQKPRLFVVPLLFRLVSTVPPLRRWAFWFISQLWTAYRDSPAVAGSGPAKESPKAGERAPHGSFEVSPEAGKSIFEILRGPEHHLLLFEGAETYSTRMDATRGEVEGLLDRYKAPVSVRPIPAENRKLHDRYGAETPHLFLVRPDGHIAYRGGSGDIAGLKVYLDGLFEECRSCKEYNDSPRDAERSVRA